MNTSVIDLALIQARLDVSPFAKISHSMVRVVQDVLTTRRHGFLDSWVKVVRDLPLAESGFFMDENHVVVIGDEGTLTNAQKTKLEKGLKSLHPWRKGPFNLCGVYVDSEWRSNYKWTRVLKAAISLKGKTILDIGCGNGYYIFQMLAGQAKFVLGVEPSQLFKIQFEVMRKYCHLIPAEILPIRFEELPFQKLQLANSLFDVVLSMGVLYHRKNPVETLRRISNCMTENGDLILETLIVDACYSNLLVPEHTYAKMSNVSAIPSEARLREWLAMAGINQIATIDISNTTMAEQRSTPWMTFESFADFLDPNDSTKTIEGYPAPKRIVLHCRR